MKYKVSRNVVSNSVNVPRNVLGLIQFRLAPSLNRRVTKLLERDYTERADYTSFDGDRYIPGAQRAVFLGVDYRWN